MRGLDAPALLEAAKAGDNDACERLLMDNSGLIWSVARRYYTVSTAVSAAAMSSGSSPVAAASSPTVGSRPSRWDSSCRRWRRAMAAVAHLREALTE